MNNLAEQNEFLSWSSSFSHWKMKPTQRYYTTKVALNLFLQHDGQVIVETGCQRAHEDWGAGCSTQIFGEFCAKYGKKLYTVDNNAGNLNMAKEITKDYAGSIEYHLGDSVAFLRDFSQPIDLLYLDSLDCPIDERESALEAQKHALNELLAASNNLQPTSVVMVDDNDWKHGGKSYLVKRYLQENDWIVLLDEKQSVWIRR